MNNLLSDDLWHDSFEPAEKRLVIEIGQFAQGNTDPEGFKNIAIDALDRFYGTEDPSRVLKLSYQFVDQLYQRLINPPTSSGEEQGGAPVRKNNPPDSGRGGAAAKF